MLSDQCETTTKVALFQGKDKELFRDRKEFKGSILKQLEDVYQFIDLVNKTKATFTGLDRTDRRDYPEDAIRESLLNSIVHRDYSFSGSNLVNIYEDKECYRSLNRSYIIKQKRDNHCHKEIQTCVLFFYEGRKLIPLFLISPSKGCKRNKRYDCC